MGENGEWEKMENGRKWRMGEKNNGILEKTSPNSPFITHHSSLIISSISTSPKFLRSPFFQTAKLLQNITAVPLKILC